MLNSCHNELICHILTRSRNISQFWFIAAIMCENASLFDNLTIGYVAHFLARNMRISEYCTIGILYMILSTIHVHMKYFSVLK